MENIVLIGMPGSGKSTLGVLIAKMTGRKFLDTDIGIQSRYGTVLSELIGSEGTDGFRDIEAEYLAGLHEEGTVIATGGSAVYYPEAMENLGKNGKIVYLRVPFLEIQKRVGDLKKRGVVIKEGQTFRDLYDERVPLYEKYADITVDVGNSGISEAATSISELLLND